MERGHREEEEVCRWAGIIPWTDPQGPQQDLQHSPYRIANGSEDRELAQDIATRTRTSQHPAWPCCMPQFPCL